MKSFYFLFIGALLLAGNLQADDDLYQSPADLSMADRVAIEHLLKKMDAEEKAARDKAEREWAEKHTSSGGDASGLIFPAIIILVVGWGLVNSKSERAGKIYIVVCLALTGVIVVLVAIDAAKPNPPPVNTSELLSSYYAGQAETKAKEKAELERVQSQISSLKSEIADLQRNQKASEDVLDAWKQYHADARNTKGYSEWHQDYISDSKQLSEQIEVKQNQLQSIQAKQQANNKPDDFESRMEAKEMVRRRLQMDYGNALDASLNDINHGNSPISKDRAEKYYGPAAREEMREFLKEHGSPNPSESDIDFGLKLNERLESNSGN